MRVGEGKGGSGEAHLDGHQLCVFAETRQNWLKGRGLRGLPLNSLYARGSRGPPDRGHIDG